jgi:hypothetical protein
VLLNRDCWCALELKASAIMRTLRRTPSLIDSALLSHSHALVQLGHPKKGNVHVQKSQGTVAQAASHSLVWLSLPNLVKLLLSQAKLSQTELWQHFFFFFRIYYHVPWGTEPHVALLRQNTYAFCALKSVGPHNSAFLPPWPKTIIV